MFYIIFHKFRIGIFIPSGIEPKCQKDIGRMIINISSSAKFYEDDVNFFEWNLLASYIRQMDLV